MAQADQTVITITLPEDGDLPRTGSIIVKRGELATIRQFQYSDIDGITAAMISAAEALIDVERNPPPMEIKAAPRNAEVLKKGKSKDKPAEPKVETPAVAASDAPAATPAPESTGATGTAEEAEPAMVQESFLAEDSAVNE